MPLLIPEELPAKLFREDGKRLDGREVDQLRHFACKIGVLNNANGSAYVEMGGNKIFAGVYGPREVHPRHMARSDRGILRVYYRMATFSVHERKSPAPNRRELEISKIIEDAIEPIMFMELYPNAAIEVYVEVMAADGGTRCASTTCVALALADAGIPMKTLVAGVAAGKADGRVILDCSDKEDKGGEADMPVAVQMKDERINLLQFDGQMSPEELDLALKYVKKGAQEIFKAEMNAIKEKYMAIQRETEEENKKIPADLITHDKELPSDNAPIEATGDKPEKQE
jgi:exosome complex component RRP41